MMHVVDGTGTAYLPPTSTQAIVTLVLGEAYRGVWEVCCRAGWERFAALNGYDLYVVTAPLDDSTHAQARSPAWQKLLVLEQSWASRYDRILWLDADIVVADHAPSPTLCVPDPSLIGVVQSGEQMSLAAKHIYFERSYELVVEPTQALAAWEMHVDGQFGDLLRPSGTPMLASGVFVASPRHHAGLLRTVYAGFSSSPLYEQPLFSCALTAAKVVQPLSPRFNWGVNEFLTVDCPFAVRRRAGELSAAEVQDIVAGLRRELAKAYFLHFAGSMPVLRLVSDLLIRQHQSMTNPV